jgi:hypothetical protein
MRRTDLFLVRVWAGDATMGGDGTNSPICRGRVQRVADGESYSFDDWQGLTDVLAAMLNGITPNPSPAAPQGDDSHHFSDTQDGGMP